MPSVTIDIEALYAALDAKRTTAGQSSWRAVARELGITPSTFTRLAQGRRPDVDTFATLLQWLNMPADAFFRSAAALPGEPETMVVISSSLRADRQLSEQAATSLQELFQVAYRMATHQQETP